MEEACPCDVCIFSSGYAVWEKQCCVTGGVWFTVIQETWLRGRKFS